MFSKDLKIYVAGHRGMVGSAIEKKLKAEGYFNIITKSHNELNLLNQYKVDQFFKKEKIDIVILAAAKVGGIQANTKYPADFLYENLMIQCNIMYASYHAKIKKLCFLGSSCIYPKKSPQPIKEEYLLDGKLEPTNEGYAIAKIAGLKLAEYYTRQYKLPTLNLMPCNIYGTNDHFDLNKCHVLSALIKKFVDAMDSNVNKVIVWGSGKARREFIHVNDVADAVLYFLMNYESSEIINIGWGIDITIKDLAFLIAKETGFKGDIILDTSKPDGMMRKCLDVTKMKNAGFQPKVDLCYGIEQTIIEYKQYKKLTKIID